MYIHTNVGLIALKILTHTHEQTNVVRLKERYMYIYIYIHIHIHIHMHIYNQTAGIVTTTTFLSF